jgi:hypothetical protein
LGGAHDSTFFEATRPGGFDREKGFLLLFPF